MDHMAPAPSSLLSLDLDLPGGPARVHTYFSSTDRDEFRDWVVRVRERHVAFDVETTGLSYVDPAQSLRLVQFGTSDEAWVILPEFRDDIDFAAHQFHRPLAHNCLFDASWLSFRLGINMEPVLTRTIDTQVLGQLYDPRPAFYSNEDDLEPEGSEQVWEEPTGLGLKGMSVRFLGEGADRYEIELHQSQNLPSSGKGKIWQAIWENMEPTDPTLLRYAAADVVLTCRLRSRLWSLLSHTEAYDLLPVEMRVVNSAYRIMKRGLRLNVDAVDGVESALRLARHQWDSKLLDFDVKNADSPMQVREALVAAGAPLRKKTAKGALSTDKYVLEGLSDNYPVAHAIREARRSKGYAGKYAAKLKELASLSSTGDRIYPFIRVTGARTGRWSMADPPIQQWPKMPYNTGFGIELDLRSLFLSEPGQVLVACDLASIEFVVAAAVTGDKNMLTAVGTTLDQKITAYDDLAKELGLDRKTAKTVVLGGQYGAGAEKLAVIFGTNDINRMKRIKAMTFGGYYCTDPTCDIAQPSRQSCKPHLKWEDGFYAGPRQFRRRIESAWADGWKGELREGWPGIRNHYGRWVPARTQPMSKVPKPNWFTIFNHTVQGSSRDLLMRMLLSVEDAGLTPWLTIHDEIVVLADAVDAPDAQRELLNVMQCSYHPRFQVPIRAEVGAPKLFWGQQHVIGKG